MPINFNDEREEFVACFRGQERSPLLVKAAKKNGYFNIFQIVNGMISLSRLSPEDIRAIYGKDSHFTLISDRSESNQNLLTATRCKQLLNLAGIDFDTISNDELIIYLRQAGIPDDEIPRILFSSK